MKPDQDKPSDGEKGKTMCYHVTSRRQTDEHLKEEIAVTVKSGSEEIVYRGHHESRVRSFELDEITVGALGEEPEPTSPDADLTLPPSDLGLLPRPNRLQLPSGSEDGAAADESNATR